MPKEAPGKHSHNLVEDYDGLIGFGLDRETDEVSLMVYLQKFSDDEFLRLLVPRLSDEEIMAIFESLNAIMKNHLTDVEYHRCFLKD